MLLSDPHKSRLTFNFAVAALLSLPLCASFVFAQTMSRADAIVLDRPLRLDYSLANCKPVIVGDEVESHDRIVRHYLTPNSKMVGVVARQASMYRGVHELFFCLLASGWKPEVVKTIDIPGKTQPLHAAVVRIRRHNKTYLSLLWYQWSLGTAAQLDDVSWRYHVMEMMVKHTLPIYREVRVAMHTPESPDDLKTLTTIASDLSQGSM